MDRLVIVRHGSYDRQTGRLDDLGRRQINTAAELIEPLIAGQRSIILTSTAPRALDSTEVLHQVLGVGYDEHEVLWSDNHRRERPAKVLELVDSYGPVYQVLILVTHFEYTEVLPNQFTRRDFGYAVTEVALDTGQVLVLDWRTQAINRPVLTH